MKDTVSLYKKIDFDKTAVLHLVLGSACNMHCRHCFQMPYSKENLKRCKIDPKVWELLENYVRFAMEKDASERPIFDSWRNKCDFRYIEFWGGEPLLYWDLMKEVIVRLTEKFDILKTKRLRFKTTSNGLLLTQDKVDFLNKYEVMFSLSYDAPNPFAVRGFVPDKICKLVDKIDNYYITCAACNAYNNDILLAYKCIRAKFPHSLSPLIIYTHVNSFDVPSDIVKHNWKEIADNMKKLRIAAQLGDEYAINFFKGFFFRRMKYKKTHDEGFRLLTCLLREGHLSVTPDGKFMACPNAFVFGTVDDSLDDLNKKIVSFINKKKSSFCQTCRHNEFCKYKCCMDMQYEDTAFYACRNFLWKFYDIIKNEMSCLYKPLSDEEKMWYEEQEKIMNEQIVKFLNVGKGKNNAEAAALERP